MKLNLKVWSATLGTAASTTFVLCVLYGLIVPAEFHMVAFVEAILPGFHWLTFGSFVIGLIESFLYGVYAALVIVPLHNFLYRRFVAEAVAKVDEKGAIHV